MNDLFYTQKDLDHTPYELSAYVSVMFWHVQNRILISDIVKVKINECERESFMV
jgi:hypothetical protein